eukprot:TRINITY_DN6328_c0_g1_i1.p1 TRINITY_DN6328_c0_g1~~TRINITY_DN6328_c0_g1_i1.p1  ORF type:complete len:286 (+),score=41.53 TRINITY_DN6328_c0_g1_i1:129-860(+)
MASRRKLAVLAGSVVSGGAFASSLAWRSQQQMPTEAERLDVFDQLAKGMLEGRLTFQAGPTAPWRREILRRAYGDVLEVACGCGANFQHYTKLGVDSLTATDLCQHMLEVASRDGSQHLGPIPLRLVLADSETLEGFEDQSFDTVVDTFGLCSYEHPSKALSEMCRVCRPGGQVLLLEHGVAEWSVIRALQHFTSEAWAKRFGCRQDHDILALVRSCDRLEIVEQKRHFLGMSYMLICKPVLQ